ncbi:MAG: hypothetical protein WCI97_12180 [Bacteroidota bacterium]
MFYFSYLECNKSLESTFAVSLHPYRVFQVEAEADDYSYSVSQQPNMDFELYKLIMSN